MLIYHILFLFILIISVSSLFIKINKYKSVFIALILMVFGSIRYKMGMDYESYEEIFDSILSRPMSFNETLALHMEPGYGIILSLFKSVGFDKLLFFTLHMVLSLYFVSKAIMKYSHNVFVSWLIMYGVYYANLFFNGMRQGLFIAIIMYILPDMLEKGKNNFLKILLISSILAVCLHKTAMILPIIYIICLFSPSYVNKYIILSGALIWAFTGIGAVLVQVGGLSFFKDSAYLSVIDFYTNNEFFGAEITFFSISVMHRLVILVLALYFSNFKTADPIFKKLTNIYFWGAIIYFILVPLGYIMATRVSMNLKVFDVLLIPYFLIYFKEYIFKMIGLIVISIWSFAVMLTNFYIPGNYEHYVPYRSILSK